MESVEHIPVTFDKKFINDYARRLIDDPEVAIVELISNCSDAGANIVEIEWPEEQFGNFTIKDDGTGMTFDEFSEIWNTLSYNRREHGNDIVFPPGNTKGNRKLFGKNGKGRFSLFCFDDSYKVETSKNGERCEFRIQRRPERRTDPIQIELLNRVNDTEPSHETIISSYVFRNHVEVDRLVELIGCKFLADPSLRISVNGELIELTSLNSADPETVMTSLGEIKIYTLDSGRGGRTSHPHGVAWHVNGKGVGNVGWRDPNRMYNKLDARTTEAKRITFIVVADILADFVNSDWTGFVDCDETDEVLGAIDKHIRDKLDVLFYEKRQERKQAAMNENEKDLSELPESSNHRIRKYVDDLQSEVRTIDQPTLNAAVKVLANMEEARTGYGLLHQLSTASADDIDTLHDLLSKWSVQDAKIVLEELGKRLFLIKQLEKIVNAGADELHEIHPLFERGLWIFGPEYESPHFRSNKWLSTVIRDLLGDQVVEVERPQRRPDLVALPDCRLRVFSHDSFDDRGEVEGIDKVLIIELKSGEVSLRDMRQVEDYARAISESRQQVQPDTKILCIAVGSRLSGDTRRITVGEKIVVQSCDYQTVIRRAQARTFHLKQKIEEARASI